MLYQIQEILELFYKVLKTQDNNNDQIEALNIQKHKNLMKIETLLFELKKSLDDFNDLHKNTTDYNGNNYESNVEV